MKKGGLSLKRRRSISESRLQGGGQFPSLRCGMKQIRRGKRKPLVGKETILEAAEHFYVWGKAKRGPKREQV